MEGHINKIDYIVINIFHTYVGMYLFTPFGIFTRYANNTNATFSFHGPPAADEFPGTIN